MKFARKSSFYIYDKSILLRRIVSLNTPYPVLPLIRWFSGKKAMSKTISKRMSAPLSLSLSLTLLLQANQCWSQLQFQTRAEMNTAEHKPALFRDMNGEGFTLCRKGAELGRVQFSSGSTITDLFNACELFYDAGINALSTDAADIPVALLTADSNAANLAQTDLDSSLVQWPEDILELGSAEEIITGAFNYHFRLFPHIPTTATPG